MLGITKPIKIVLLLAPFVLVTGATEVLSEEMTDELAKMPMIILPTDNGSTNVEIKIENAMAEGNQFTVDEPGVVTFDLRFINPATSAPINHTNYTFMVKDTNGNMIFRDNKGHTHDGITSYYLLFSDTGSYATTIDIEGTGANYDKTTHSGTVISSLKVTPEFPLGMMAVMAAVVVGIAIAASRFKNPLALNR